MLNRFETLAVIMMMSLAGLAKAIELPEGFVDESWLSGLPGQVTGFDGDVDGRLFVSEKSGIVRVVRNGTLLDTPFIDLRDEVNDRVDRGLLSVAVHPDFPSQPHVYLLYTFDPPELVENELQGPGVPDGNGNRVARLVRYTADASNDFDVALPGSDRIILGSNSTFEAIGDAEARYDTDVLSCGPVEAPMRDCLPVDEDSHTIGAMRFASDGSLYVSNGDGASYRSFEPHTRLTYDLDSLRGKILRIDPETGEAMPDNPFHDGDPTSNRSKVLSLGLRNPYSMTIHPLTGVPYVGDVGEEEWEEINGGIARNFGWPCYEGGRDGNVRQPGFEPQDFCQALFASDEPITAPLLAWEHQSSGSSAIVGDFYLSEVFPASYSGRLFYADFIQGWMRHADVSDPTAVESAAFATDMMPMTEIRVAEDGAIYYASITTGEIRRIRFVGEQDGGSEGGATGGTDDGDGDGADGDGGTADQDADGDEGSGADTGASQTDSRVKVGALSVGMLCLVLLPCLAVRAWLPRRRLRRYLSS